MVRHSPVEPRLLYVAHQPDEALMQAIGDDGNEVVATSPEQIDSALGSHYRFILLDLITAAPSLLSKCLARRGQAEVMVLLEQGDRRARIDALQAGADLCLERPVSNLELRARMEALTRHFSTPGPLAEAGLWLSNNRLLLGRGRRHLSVTVTEQRLLALLAEQGGPLSRQVIEAHIWGDHQDARGALIERHVCNLRRKLAELDAPYALQTLRGVGYALSERVQLRTD